MILTGLEIERQIVLGAISIHPFNKRQVNPNSYDLRLGNRILTYTDSILDTRNDNPVTEVELCAGGFKLSAGRVYLGASHEALGGGSFVPMLHAKSGIARLGLFVHATADLIDIGFQGNITFQLIPTLDITVYPHMLIAQVTFWKTLGEITLYKGKYQGSIGPQPSKSHQDV